LSFMREEISTVSSPWEAARQRDGRPCLEGAAVWTPKMLVSTLKIVQAGLRPYTQMKDIAVMPSPVDIAGLNRLTMRILANAAGAISGMVEAEEIITPDKPLVAVGCSEP